MIIYEMSGDNLHTSYFVNFRKAAEFLLGCAYTEKMPLIITQNQKAVYHRKTDEMFGAGKDQYAYIGWIKTEDEK
jgi:hypothetical protein